MICAFYGIYADTPPGISQLQYVTGSARIILYRSCDPNQAKAGAALRAHESRGNSDSIWLTTALRSGTSRALIRSQIRLEYLLGTDGVLGKLKYVTNSS